MLPIPDGQVINDVDAPLDDNDEEAKPIASNCLANSQVNINFDRDLLDGGDAIEDTNDTAIPELANSNQEKVDDNNLHLLHELHKNNNIILDTDTIVNNDKNDVKIHESSKKDIATSK